jgi:hypothetical protein
MTATWLRTLLVCASLSTGVILETNRDVLEGAQNGGDYPTPLLKTDTRVRSRTFEGSSENQLAVWNLLEKKKNS